MDCKTAHLLLEFARPQATELQASEAAVLESHLAGCSECEALARSERQADAQLGAAMRDVPVPDGLRCRLLTRLEIERNAYYRRWLGRAVAGGAAAAAIFLAVLLYAGWRTTVLPSFNAQDEIENERYFLARSSVEDLFSYQGVKVVAPAQFDYHYCRWAGLTEHNKKRVPMLYFIKPRLDEQGGIVLDRARVFIISKKEFNTADFQEDASGSGGCKSKSLPGPNPNVEYLIFFTGDLTSFFDEANRQNVGGGA